MPVLQQPEVYISSIQDYVENGEVTNENTIKFLKGFIDSFTDLVERYRG